MFNFIKLRVGSLIGQIVHKEENIHDEKTLNLDQSRTHLGDHIEKQVVFNVPEGQLLSESQQKKLEASVLGEDEGGIENENEFISTDAKGDAQLIAATTNKQTEDFLHKHLEENQSDNNLLLDRGGLLLIYKEREAISFTEEELIFLVQSSIKHEFPLWFWIYYYREKFGNVVPLLQKAFSHPSSKVRRGGIDALSDFLDTEDDIAKLAENESNPDVLGFIASNLLEKKNTDCVQRVIANALTRKIIPVLTEKSQQKREETKIDLGAAEKRFLYSVINNGWSEEKTKALTILSLSTGEEDLLTLENLFEKITYSDTANLILNCFKRIGKTSKTKEIEKELLETRRQESFIALLDALVAVKYKLIFPQLLEWLRDISRVTNQLWGDANERKLEEKIQSAIFSLLDKDTYELLVQYILKHYSPDKYGNIMSWRHFRVLRDKESNPEIISLIKAETRLVEFEPWQEVISGVELKEKTSVKNKEQLLSFITPEDTDQNLAILKEVYEIITPAQALIDVKPLIEELRANLSTRLKSIASEEHPEEVKEIAENNLEDFLGENSFFYSLSRKRKKGSRYKIEGEEDKIFEKLSKDIDNFNNVEKEYLTHIFKSKSPEINKILMDNIGRSYECIYENIEKNTDDTEELTIALSKVIENHQNPLVKLKAIEAALRIEVTDTKTLRETTILLLREARDKVKPSRGMSKDKDGDDWFVYELAYIWSVNTLIEFGNADDFPLIQEATNREKIITRSYHWYNNFFDHNVFENLLNLTEDLEDNEERKSAMTALNSLDYKWTKKILSIET